MTDDSKHNVHSHEYRLYDPVIFSDVVGLSSYTLNMADLFGFFKTLHGKWFVLNMLSNANYRYPANISDEHRVALGDCVSTLLKFYILLDRSCYVPKKGDWTKERINFFRAHMREAYCSFITWRLFKDWEEELKGTDYRLIKRYTLRSVGPSISISHNDLYAILVHHAANCLWDFKTPIGNTVIEYLERFLDEDTESSVPTQLTT